MAINAGSVYSELVLDISKYEQNLKKAEQQMNTLAKNLEKAGDKIKNVGEKLSKYVTVPIVGAGAASLKFAGDFEESINKVSTIADTAVKSTDEIKEGIMSLSDQLGIASTELSEALYQTISATGDTANSLDYVEVASKAAIGGFTDTATAIDGLTTVLNAYGLKGSEAIQKVSDQMLMAQNYGKTTFGEMASSIGNVIPIAASLNITTEELFGSIATLTKNGIQTSQAITGLKAAYSNILKPSKEAAELAANLGIEFNAAHLKSVGWAKFLDEIREKTGGNSEQLATLFGSVEALNSVTVLATTGAEDFAGALDAMSKSAGATEKAFTKMDQGTKDSIEDTLNKLKNLGIELADTFLPTVNKLLDKVSEWIDKFKALDDGTKETIVKLAVLAAAMGPVLTIGGKMASGIGSIIGIFSKFKAASTAATAATSATATGFSLAGAAAKAGALLLNPWTAAIAAATAGGIALYKHLQKDSIPTIDLFGETVSESTKKAVEGYLELDDKATQSLMNLKFTSETVTEETSNSLINTFNTMGEQIKTGMDAHFQETYSIMETFFANSSALTDAEEAIALEKMRTNNENRKEEINMYTEQIQDILEEASQEKRALTKKEQERINEIQQEMKEKAVNYLSENELEAKVIMERMKQQAGEITAKQAAEVVQNSLRQKEEAIKAAEEQYNEVIKEIIRQRDEAGTITEEQADKLIAEATRQRDEAIAKATEMHNQVVEQAKLQAGEHVNQVDWETGEIKTKWQVMRDDVIKKAKEIKNNVIEKAEQLKTEYSRKIEELSESIEKKFNEIANDAISWGSDVINGFIKGVTNLKDKAVEKVKEFGDNIASGFKNILGISSPSKIFEKFGEFTIEGYVKGIEKNKYEAINSIEDVGNTIIRQYDKLGDAVIKALQSKYKEEEQLQVNSLNKQINNIREATDKKIQQYNRELAVKLQLIDDEANEEIKRIQNAINAINKKTEEEEKLLKEQAYQAKVAELEKKIAESESAEERAEIQKELNELKADRERELILEQRQMQIDAMYEEINRIREQASKKKLEFEKEYENKQEIIEKETDATIAGLEKEIEATKSHYEKLLEEEKLQAEARILILDENNEELIELLESYNPKWQDAGQSFGESLLFGLNSMKTSIQQAVEEILSLVGKAERAKANIEAQNAVIIQAKKDWEEAYKSGDKEAMEEAHRRAEEARRKGGTIGYDKTLEEALKKIGHNALGTNYWRGGLTWVGEQGPELIELPKGTKIYSNQKSMEMISQMGRNITQNITINSPTPLSPSEIARKNLQISRQLAMEWGF